ncbi:hypothetical protein ACHAPA_005366 [Fusarium lateritium]
MTVLQSCAVKIGDEGLLGGQKLGASDIEIKLVFRRPRTLEQYLGLFIDFPLAASNVDEGFGQCHTPDYQSRPTVPCEFRRLKVKFPGEIEVSFWAATEEEVSKIPKRKANMFWVEVPLKQGAKTTLSWLKYSTASWGR